MADREFFRLDVLIDVKIVCPLINSVVNAKTRDISANGMMAVMTSSPIDIDMEVEVEFTFNHNEYKRKGIVARKYRKDNANCLAVNFHSTEQEQQKLLLDLWDIERKSIHSQR